MAILDYGSVVKKNGKIIQNEMFMNMKEAVGFTIDTISYKYFSEYSNKEECCEVKINDNCFSYIGDEELLLCIYKGSIYFISNGQILKIQRDLWLDYDIPYCLQKLEFSLNEIDFRIKRLFNQNRYLLRFVYKGDLYEVIYGYGVDVDKDSWYNVSRKEKRYSQQPTTLKG